MSNESELSIQEVEGLIQDEIVEGRDYYRYAHNTIFRLVRELEIRGGIKEDYLWELSGKKININIDIHGDKNYRIHLGNVLRYDSRDLGIRFIDGNGNEFGNHYYISSDHSETVIGGWSYSENSQIERLDVTPGEFAELVNNVLDELNPYNCIITPVELP